MIAALDSGGPSCKGLDLLIPVHLGPHISRFTGRYKDDNPPVISLEDSGFREAFKSSNDVFE
jgi:hypothetical protein